MDRMETIKVFTRTLNNGGYNDINMISTKRQCISISVMILENSYDKKGIEDLAIDRLNFINQLNASKVFLSKDYSIGMSLINDTEYIIAIYIFYL